MTNSTDFRDEVREKIANLKYFEENPEDLARVFHFLDQADKECFDATDAAFSPYWKNFKYLLKKERAFKALAKRYAEDTKSAEENPKFLKVMRDMYQHMLDASEDSVPLSEAQSFDLQRLVDKNTAQNFGFGGLARAWDVIPVETRTRLVQLIPSIVNNRSLVFSADEAISVVNKYGGKVAMYGLAAVYLSYHAILNIRRWWKGEISGKRCAKNVIDASATTLAGVGGGIGGAALGTMVAPGFGTVLGGIAGGVIASNVASFLCDRLTQWLFDLPKDEAVENAYRYLGVSCTASNAEVNKAFRVLCLKHHPDKPGGSKEEFFVLQNNMAVIRLARGEY